MKNGRGHFIPDIWIVRLNRYHRPGRNIGKYGSNGNHHEHHWESTNSFFLFIGVRTTWRWLQVPVAFQSIRCKSGTLLFWNAGFIRFCRSLFPKNCFCNPYVRIGNASNVKCWDDGSYSLIDSQPCGCAWYQLLANDASYICVRRMIDYGGSIVKQAWNIQLNSNSKTNYEREHQVSFGHLTRKRLTNFLVTLNCNAIQQEKGTTTDYITSIHK